MPFAWVSAAASIYGASQAGKNGGSGGGNAPPVYQPKDLSGRDDNFLWAENAYGGMLNNYFGNVDPYNYTMLQQQFNNPMAAGYQTGANQAGEMAAGNAKNWQNAANSMYGNANSTANWGNLIQNGLTQTGAPRVDQSFNTMMDMGGQSNQEYAKLMAYQQAQQGNVQNSADRLYGSGNRVLNTAFDPQNALYNRTASQVEDQTRAAEYARGVQSSPAGASQEANAMSNFNIDWQNQQLARQTQGLQSAQGAYGSAQGMNNSYVNNLSGLQTAKNQNYSGLAEGATSMYGNWGQAQANVANTMANANGKNYATATTLGNQAEQSMLNSGQYPYQAYQTMYGNQNQALGNYWNNLSPYMSGLNQLQSNDLGYMNYGQGAQNQAWNQNNQNANQMNNYMKQLGSAFGSQGGNAWGWLTGGNSNSNGGYQYYNAPGDGIGP